MAKSKWDMVKDKLLLVEGWARNGLTDVQIAKNLSISERTLNDYKIKYPQFLQALKKGKEVVDLEVENALLKRALGYKYTEVKTKVTDDGTEVTKTVKEVIPDVTAQIYWLKNRKPEQWRDRPENEKRPNTELMEALVNTVQGDGK